METQPAWPLLPVPRYLHFTEERFVLPADGLIALESADAQALWFTAVCLQTSLHETAAANWEIVAGTAVPTDQIRAVLSIVPGGVGHPQGYELTITDGRIHVVAVTAAGIFYAVQTLRQLLAQGRGSLPGLRCRDWPDFPNRGVMLDISRDKVPTLSTLFELVDLLASWKINQFQLYTEHTFAYRRHPIVWAEASPLTGEDILALDAYCRERFVELVPNQNSFGHMRRWLTHAAYKHLAECPDGCDTIWGHFYQPFTLYPGDPASLDLLRDLYDELLPHFSSRQFNVGCDETVDLGRGRSKSLVNQVGEGRVYLDFLLKIYREVKARGFTMQFWGDILMRHPELVAELPRDVIALEWGYEADHPFDAHGAILAASGIPFYVCPGTSSWNSVGGRTANALGNLLSAAVNGRQHGAIGYLITDWGDNGHWQPLPVSYLGFAYGSAVAWATDANKTVDVARALDHYAFGDTAGIMGQYLYDLGNIYTKLSHQTINATLFFLALQAEPKKIATYARTAEETTALYARLTDVKSQLDGLVARLPQATMIRPDAELIQRELTWAANLLRHACWRIAWVMGKSGVESTAASNGRLVDYLAADATALLAEHEVIWHARNRPGGFRESQARLERLRSDYTAAGGPSLTEVQ